MARIWPTPGTRTGIHGGLGRELDVIELLPLAQTGDDYETSLPWNFMTRIWLCISWRESHPLDRLRTNRTVSSTSDAEKSIGDMIRQRRLRNNDVVNGLNTEELHKHAEPVEKLPDMAHDESYMAHVDTGQQGDVIWQFDRLETFGFACLLPGHFQAGMVGKIQPE
ncbi:cupredoxin domain-containing protein [Orrella marina]|uniref:Uncharacterized protein n=1 Tax=Orrella marina TaxID=2163011 RepID=A0A2R4XG13_9BURK|nr:hypothetical protein [Orrella marina]AWB32757.1 hypothetical protein DBV39_02400 [Orrella marina]